MDSSKKDKIKDFIVAHLDILLYILVILGIIMIFKARKYTIDPIFPQIQVDTVYIHKAYVETKGYKVIEVPKLVLVWQDHQDTVLVNHTEVIHDTIKYYLTSGVSLETNSHFITDFPNAPRLINFNLDQKSLLLATQSTDGMVYQSQYNLDLKKYHYAYADKALTKERNKFIQNFHPLVQAQYRPVNKLIDLNLGIKYDTSNLQYEAGINSFYYPKFSKKVGFDPYLRLTYIF